MKPYISVIVPTTRVGGLDVLYSGLELQKFKDFELIIADSLYEYRKDIIKEQSKKYSFSTIHLSQLDTATDLCKAMNNALINANGHIIYILCDYTWLDANCLQMHADFHKNKKINEKFGLVGHFYDCKLPGLHKDFYRSYASNVPYYPEEVPNKFVIKERENFNNYMEDIKTGKLNSLMWSTFKEPYTVSSNPNSFEVSVQKQKLPEGIISVRDCVLKNESYTLETMLDINGFNEELDGSHGWQDWELLDRMTTLTNTKLYCQPQALAYTLNPRTILYARYRQRDVFSNEKIWKDGVSSNFNKKVNNWSLRDAHNKIG